jgi:uncharacterized protein (TIGR02246 family)
MSLPGATAPDNNEDEAMRLTGFNTAALSICAILLASAGSQAADTDAVQQLLDKAQIDAVLVRYTHALDTLDADKYASVFTEDAVFEQGAGNARHGRDEIRSIITGLLASREERESAGTATPTLMHHVMTNATLDFVSADEAHHYAYWMTILGDTDNGFRVASMGHYEDVLVKRDGHWLIKNRKLLR